MQGKYAMNTRISSYDVGPMRRLKPSSILMLIQETAGRHLECDGLSYEFMRDKGIVFLLVKEAIKVVDLPRCSDEITIETWFERTSGVQFLRGMSFCDAKGKTLLEALTYWIIANPDTHKILRPSSFPFDMPSVESKGIDVCAQRITMPENTQNVGVRTVRYSDIDCNNHMNNAVYADLICDYFPGGLGQRELRSFQVNFEGEAVLGEEINIRTGVDETGTAVFEGTIGGRKCFEAIAAVK
jgi:acyl-ACP thioesterase